MHLLHGPAGLRAAVKLDQGHALRLLGVLVPHHSGGREAFPGLTPRHVRAPHREDAAAGPVVQVVRARTAHMATCSARRGGQALWFARFSLLLLSQPPPLHPSSCCGSSWNLKFTTLRVSCFFFFNVHEINICLSM